MLPSSKPRSSVCGLPALRCQLYRSTSLQCRQNKSFICAAVRCVGHAVDAEGEMQCRGQGTRSGTSSVSARLNDKSSG